MKAINTKELLLILNQAEAKLIEIDKIPRFATPDHENRRYGEMNIEADDEEFTYSTSENTRCSSPDEFVLYVKFSEINKPLSYFEKKFKKELKDYKKKQQN